MSLDNSKKCIENWREQHTWNADKSRKSYMTQNDQKFNENCSIFKHGNFEKKLRLEVSRNNRPTVVLLMICEVQHELKATSSRKPIINKLHLISTLFQIQFGFVLWKEPSEIAGSGESLIRPYSNYLLPSLNFVLLMFSDIMWLLCNQLWNNFTQNSMIYSDNVCKNKLFRSKWSKLYKQASKSTPNIFKPIKFEDCYCLYDKIQSCNNMIRKEINSMNLVTT